MPSVDAVSVSPACAVPEMVGAPVAGLDSAGCGTVFVTASGPKLSMARSSTSRSTTPSVGFV